jgi:rhomboid family GlyGly-CTERM serine protease
MPLDAANHFTQIAAALQWDRGRWIWLLLILLILAAVLGLGDNVSALLRYDRSAIAAGGWWRLLTAHIVHLDAHHLALNGLGVVLVWSLFAQDYAADEWCAIVLGGALAISCGLWWLSPQVVWYVGASGVLHSVMAAGTMKHWAEHAWDRWILLIGLCAKLSWEQWSGHAQPMVVVDAHLYGALWGFALGAALSWRMAIIRQFARPGSRR